jgi:hypothetical protein
LIGVQIQNRNSHNQTKEEKTHTSEASTKRVRSEYEASTKWESHS